MSDALCGPSNPLQQFKQQTQLDRTLQQDRLASRHSPSQGFRSATPNAGLLDPEFEAFQAGVPPSKLPHLQPFHQPPQAYAGPTQAPSWAADFQQMHISSPPPFQQQQMPPTGPATANWAQGFREHIAQTPPRAQTSASSPQHFQQMARYGGMNGFQNNFATANMGPSMQSKGKEPAMELFDEAAFERAFDQARDDMLGKEETEVSSLEAEQNTADPEDDLAKNGMYQDYQLQLLELEQQNKERLLRAREEQDRMAQSAIEQRIIREESAAKIEAERAALEDFPDDMEAIQDPHQIHQETLEEQAQAQERAREDDDALAATAQELLEKVQHNQSDKFRNSQFLGLMRKLRDREVKVEGDKMVETNNVRSAHSHLPPPSAPTSHPDLLLASHTSTPSSALDGFTMPHTPPEFDTHFERGWPNMEHDLDHWESPYR